MTRFLLLAPLALAACGTPCPVPRECITPEWCVCLVTGAVDPLPDGDGWEPASVPTAQPQPSTPPDHNGGVTADDHGNGGDTKDDTSDGGSSDENGDKSDG